MLLRSCSGWRARAGNGWARTHGAESPTAVVPRGRPKTETDEVLISDSDEFLSAALLEPLKPF